jgi:hypothetical protein
VNTLADPLFLAIVATVFVAGVSTGTTGLGFAQLTSTALGLLVDTRIAVLILSVTVPAVSGMQIIHNRRERLPMRRLLPVIIGALIGVPIGVWFLAVLPTRFIAGFLGVVTLLYVATRLLRFRPHLDARQERAVGPFAGIAGGIFNGTVGVSGPVLVPYLLSLNMPAATFAYTVSVLFVTMTVFRLFGLVVSGTMQAPTFLLGLALLVPALIGQRVGFILQRWLSRRTFEAIVLVSLILGGIALLLRGLVG